MAYPDERALSKLLDALLGLDIRVKKMFGCCCVYCDEVPVGWLNGNVFSLREVGLSYLPKELKRPHIGDSVREIVIPMEYMEADWLKAAVKDTASIMQTRKTAKR